MHLYTFDSAPNPRRLGLFLAYKGIELPTTQIDMRVNAHREDSFLQINPEGTLPALSTDEGELLTEVVGMCAYLEGIYPEKPLMGTSNLERALVLSWDHRIYGAIFGAFAEILRNGSPAFEHRALPGSIDVEQIPALVERGRNRWRAGMQLFDKELGDKAFFCGDNISLADIDLYVAVQTGRWVKEGIPESCTRLEAWMARCKDALE
ncbi:MAG: glutathione S-transferase [Congregibacter sp.]